MRGYGLVRRRPRYSAAVVAACLLGLAGPLASAQAAGKATTHVRVALTPATAKVGTTVSVSGAMTPKGGTAVLERLVKNVWVAVTHASLSRTGSYTLTFHAPKTPSTVALRVVRSASASTKAGISATVHVRVVKTAYAVSAAASATSLTLPAAATISGKVTPKGSGSVVVERLVGATWTSLGKATLSTGSTFVFSKTLAAGSYTVRVRKPFSTTVAGGVSRRFAIVVAAAPPPAPPVVTNPVVTTTALPAMTVGRPVSVALAATGGTAPYSWAVVAGALTPGLTLIPSGAISGSPTVVGPTTFTVRVTDALRHSGTGVVTTTVGPVVVRAWGENGLGEAGNGTTTPTDTVTTTALPAAVKTISVGLDYSMALLTDGTVYAWGQNNSGQLGLGDTTARPTPAKIPSLSQVVSIAAGLASSYAVTAGGQVYAWGANEAGELANGTTSSTATSTPQLITSIANVIAVAANGGYALALFASGRVDSWGNGMQGTLGNGTETSAQTTPVGIDTIGQVASVAAGTDAAYALLDDGTVRSWGRAEHGELGNTSPPRDTTWQPLPEVVTGLTNVASLACSGFEYCLVARTDGTVAAWGDSNWGVQGNGTQGGTGVDNLTAATVPGLTSIVQVAAGYGTAYALRSDGSLFAWGEDDINQLGTGDATHTQTAAPALVLGLGNVVAVAAGSQTAFALRAG